MIDLTKYTDFLKFSIGQVNKDNAKTITFKVYQTNEHTLKLVVGNHTYTDKDYKSNNSQLIEGTIKVKVDDLSIVDSKLTNRKIKETKRKGSSVPLGTRFY